MQTKHIIQSAVSATNMVIFLPTAQHYPKRRDPHRINAEYAESVVILPVVVPNE